MPLYRAASSFLVLCCLLACTSAGWALDRKRDLAERLISNPDVVADQQATRQVLTNMTARRLFFGLRKDSDWGAEHPLWRQRYPEFLRDYRKVVDNHLGDVAALQREGLLARLDEEALAQVLALRTAPDVVALFTRLRSAGVSAATALWIPDIVTNPRYYSKAEQANAERLQQKLMAPDATLAALMTDMAEKMKRFQTPAYSAYTNTIRETLFSPIENFPSLPEARPALLPLMREWHDRVNAGPS